MLALESHLDPDVLEETDPRYLATMLAVLTARAEKAKAVSS